MEGLQGRLNRSVQRQLSIGLALAIAVVALAAGALSFMAAYREAQELQDDILRQVALLIDGRTLAPPGAAADAPFDGHEDHDDASRLIVQRLGQPTAPGQPVDDGGALPVPPTLADGLHTLELGGESFRVLIRTARSGARFVVAQEADLRDQMARDSALRTLLPFLVLVPMLLLVATALVRRLLRPIVTLAGAVDRRSEPPLQPLDPGPVPAEVRPFVVAINRLFARVQQAMDAQRRFVADAAHELRSPLAALQLQAERLAQAPMSDAARERLSALREGLVRAGALLNQLLTLARSQAAGEPGAPGAAGSSVQRVIRRVLEDLMPLAEARRIDLGVEGAQGTPDGPDGPDAQVRIGEADLTVLLRNLVDNAIRCTPEGGRVDLRLDAAQGWAVLRIADTGPGIAPAERERVFDAFYRVPGSAQPGSGLGLAIVRAIAERTGTGIDLDFSDPQRRSGLCVSVRMALASAAAALPPAAPG